MKKTIIITQIILFLMVLGCASNTPEDDYKSKTGLNKYPDVFIENNTFNAVIVVDDFASDDELMIVQNFLESLQKKYHLKPDTLIQYKHLDGLYNQNTIFIGTCDTKPHNKFVNLFMDCLSMEENIGMLRIVEKSNVTIISVVGKDFKDTEEALGVLINHDKYNLAGREIQVRNEGEDIVVRITG